MYEYRNCGLTVTSELELSGAILAPSSGGSVDVRIRRSPVPVQLAEVTEFGPDWETGSDHFLLRVPELARFLMTGGRDISVDINADAVKRDVVGFVLGTTFGILMHQRVALVLHGSAVARNDRAIALCGPSGAGKSTLAAALCRQGYSFVTDDLCVVGLDAQGLPVVRPNGRRLELSAESIEKLELADRCGERSRAIREILFRAVRYRGRDAQAVGSIRAARCAACVSRKFRIAYATRCHAAA